MHTHHAAQDEHGHHPYGYVILRGSFAMIRPCNWTPKHHGEDRHDDGQDDDPPREARPPSGGRN
jgi:hypothetical protein